MLTRNCAIGKLLKDDDMNVRVSVFNYQYPDDPARHNSAWFELINRSLGKEVCAPKMVYNIHILDERFFELSFSGVRGDAIIGIITTLYTSPIPLRITLTPAVTSSKVFKDDTQPSTAWVFI